LNGQKIGDRRCPLMGAFTVHTYIINRVEVNLFMLSPEIEDPGEVKVGNWTKQKKTFYSEFSFAALTVK
jgi:hypothetical protein